jgi:hypothetical protein
LPWIYIQHPTVFFRAFVIFPPKDLVTVCSHSNSHQPADDSIFLLCCHKPKRNGKKCFHYCTSRRPCPGVIEGSFPKLLSADPSRRSGGQHRPSTWKESMSLFPGGSCFHALSQVIFCSQLPFLLTCYSMRKSEQVHIALTVTLVY